jgi:hypothetical protein
VPCTPVQSGDILFQSRAVRCVATTPNVVKMRVDGIGFVVLGRRHSGHARVHLRLRDNSELAFDVSGEAVHLDKDLAPNTDGRSVIYAGVECTVTHPGIAAIRNCSGDAGNRTCEVEIEIRGHRRAYLVSMSITPIGSGVAAPRSR